MSDISWTYLDFSFVCDSNKRCTNKIKHSIDLVKASTAFADPAGISKFDDVHSSDEDRYKLLAKDASESLLCIIYTLRHNVIRIISARKATIFEGKLYENR